MKEKSLIGYEHRVVRSQKTDEITDFFVRVFRVFRGCFSAFCLSVFSVFRGCFFAVIFGLIFASSVRGEDAVRLAWKFPAGAKWHVTSESTSVSESTLGTKTSIQTLATTIDTQWEVAETVDESEAWIKQTIERVRARLELPNRTQPVVYDSAQKSRPRGGAEMFAKQIQPLIGKEFRIRMNTRGEILEAVAPETDTPSIAPEERATEPLTEEMLTQIVKSPILVLSDSESQIGATWEWERDAGTKKLKDLYTLSEQTEGAARVNWKTEFSPSDAAQGGQPSNQDQATGMAHFDVSAGRLIRAKSESRLLRVKKVREQEIKMTLTTTTETKFDMTGAER